MKLRDWLREGPYTLALSAGFFGFFAHAGALAALEDADLLPSRITGASAGALAGGIWAAGMAANGLARALFVLRREDFWDPAFGFGLLKGDRFRSKLKTVLRTERLEGVRVPLAISVFDLKTRRTQVLRSGDLAAAIHASCALPGLFQPVKIGGRLYIDGGVVDRPAHVGLDDRERVLSHFLPSQSPWRGFYSPARLPGRHPNRVTLASAGLQRVGPFSLQRGEKAFAAARSATEAALSAERP